MTSLAEVRLWGKTIGAVALADHARFATFEYDPAFRRSGIELAPLIMPLSDHIYSFSDLSLESFHGLPGLLADSLPDRFGNALINAWLALQGRTPDSFNSVERLSYVGARGMGALEYKPVLGPRTRKADRIRIDRLVDLASKILKDRDDFAASFEERELQASLKDILRIGTSAGGARAKAVIAWNPETQEVRSGQVKTDAGFEHWLIKFDGVSGNKDKELEDPKGYGAIEYAYYRMALDAGILMNPCRLLEENGRRHFMTRRFDRSENGGKIHMQSLGAMAHFDFNLAGAYSYEQAILVIRKLNLPMASVEELFRRMVFNIMARNQDDHVKNIAFLMDQSGNWSLAPAFDLTYSYHPQGRWTSVHQMTLNGKQDHFALEDFKACASAASIKRGRAETIIREVGSVLERWRDYAEEAGVIPEWRDQIAENMRLKF